MKSRFFTSLVALVLAVGTLATACTFIIGAKAQTSKQIAAQPPESHVAPDAVTCAQFEELMDAIEENNYADFLANADETVKGALTKAAFESVVAQVASQLKNGYSASYVTQLHKNGFIVSIWKIQFKQGDDLLGELSIKNGKVGGFFLR